MSSPIRLTLVGAQDAGQPLAQPKDMVTIVEGTPYTVPANKIFVLLGLGTVLVTTATVIPVALLADGVVELRAGIFGASSTTVQNGTVFYAGMASCAEVPPCISFGEGVVLTVDDGVGGQTNGRAFGYLAPE